jgi:hypothetical protein
MNDKMPLYPEYFMRSDGISLSQSVAIYNDLLSNGCLDSKKYLILSPSTIQSMVIGNPSNWGSITSLNNYKRSQVLSLLSIAYGGHEVFSNHCARTIDFFDNLCSTSVGLTETSNEGNFNIYPNPTNDLIYIKSKFEVDYLVNLFNSNGQLLISQINLKEVDLSNQSTGFYILKINYKNHYKHFKIIKQ